MLKLLSKNLLRVIDGALYGFIGPFTVLYIIPHFLMKITPVHAEEGFGIPGVRIGGIILMWLGAILATWCSALMFLYGRGTPLVTSAPQKIMARNIYGMIRNPMMWALFLVVCGEIFLYGHFILIIWLAAMCRIIFLVVVNYEEPQLERRFGENWDEYCKSVPPWFPNFGSAKMK
ncbi:MAG: isoprenylcysteine carboxylmethyltransferase family protein [Bacteroidota bacterium]